MELAHPCKSSMTPFPARRCTKRSPRQKQSLQNFFLLPSQIPILSFHLNSPRNPQYRHLSPTSQNIKMTGGKFEPKTPVVLAPPKDDPITLEKLAIANGTKPLRPFPHSHTSLTNNHHRCRQRAHLCGNQRQSLRRNGE